MVRKKKPVDQSLSGETAKVRAIEKLLGIKLLQKRKVDQRGNIRRSLEKPKPKKSGFFKR